MIKMNERFQIQRMLLLPLLVISIASKGNFFGSAFLLDGRTTRYQSSPSSCCHRQWSRIQIINDTSKHQKASSRKTFSLNSNQKRDVQDDDQYSGTETGMNDSKKRSRPIPQRRFRSDASANASKIRMKNQANNKIKTGKQKSYPLFTKTSVAPPLDLLQLDDTPQTQNDILSPSAIQNNEQNCDEYICGALPVIYTNDSKTLEKWLVDNCRPQADNQHTFLGFDVEAAPNVPWRRIANREFIDRPATVQISTPYKSIVVHLTNCNDTGSSSTASSSVLKPLQAMLSDPTILKVGAGIDEDMLELYRWNNSLIAQSRFDIGGIGSDPKKRGRVGLQNLVKAIAGVDLAKSKKIAMSDWSMVPLTDTQLRYASRDAWAGAVVMESIGRYDRMHVDSIAQMVRGKEREMHEVDSRARLRKEARLKMKKIIEEAKDMADGGSDSKVDRKESKRQQHERLLEGMSQEKKSELDRLQSILDETSPDGLIFFDSNKFGLDFSFAR